MYYSLDACSVGSDNPGMRAGQFTLMRAMFSMVFFGVGFLGIAMWIPERFESIKSVPLMHGAAILSWNYLFWIGAGIGVLWNRWREGIIAGGLIQYAIWFYSIFFYK